MKRHPDNKNLRLFYQHKWRGNPVMTEHGPVIENYLENIDVVLKRALKENSRIIIIRFDLRFPANQDVDSDRVMAKFMDSIRAQILADQTRRSRNELRSFIVKPRLIWAREQDTAEFHHFHCALILPADAYYWKGRLTTLKKDDPSVWNNTVGRIVKAWASAIGHVPEAVRALVHFCDNGLYRLNKNADDFDDNFDAAFYRLSYLAKVKTKVYGDGNRNFGCSLL